MTPDGKEWVLIDGECGFCRRCAYWVCQHDRGHRFHVAVYQEAPSPPMTPALYAACAHAVHVVRPHKTVLRAGRAVLYILAFCGWGWFARLLCLPPLVWLVELVYALVARNRAFFGRFLFRGLPSLE